MGNLTQLFGQNKRCALRQLYTFVGFVKFTPYAISAVIVQRDCAISVALLHSVRTSGNGRCGLLRLRRSNGLCGNFRFSGLRRSFGFGGSSRFGGRGRLSGSSGLRVGSRMVVPKEQFIEWVFADAKEKHAMRYTQYRGLAQVTNRVK